MAEKGNFISGKKQFASFIEFSCIEGFLGKHKEWDAEIA